MTTRERAESAIGKKGVEKLRWVGLTIIDEVDEERLPWRAADALRCLMSAISEDHCCAGWLNGLEFSLWRIVEGGSRRFGMDVIPEDRVTLLRLLSQEAGGWWLWDEEGISERFVSLAEWRAIFANREEPKP